MECVVMYLLIKYNSFLLLLDMTGPSLSCEGEQGEEAEC